MLGVVENMSNISIPMADLKDNHSNIRLVNSRGVDMTESVLFRSLYYLFQTQLPFVKRLTNCFFHIQNSRKLSRIL